MSSYLTNARAELDLLIGAVSSANDDDPVPGCGGWTVNGLATHVAAVLGMIEATRAAGSLDQRIAPEPIPDGADVVDVIAERGALVLDELGAMDPTTPMWSWAERTVAFWRRRLAFELLMHRIDAERAAGGPVSPIDPAIAADGIDEWFTTYVIGRRLWESLEDGSSVHVHCGDTDGEWMLRVESGDVTLTREHAKGDIAVRGPAAELLQMLYGRRSAADTDGVEVFGDSVVADTVLAWTI